MLLSKSFELNKIDSVTSELLIYPSTLTNIKRQLKSIFFNFLTSSFVFPFCFLIIFLFEEILPGSFGRFGSSDFLKSNQKNLKRHLSKIHFEDISPHSLQLIQEEIPNS